MNVTDEITIPVKVEQVWTALIDPETMAKWSGKHKDVVVDVNTPEGVGRRFVEEIAFKGQRRLWNAEFVEFVPFKKLTVRRTPEEPGPGMNRDFAVSETFTLASLGAKTRIKRSVEYSGVSASPLQMALLRWVSNMMATGQSPSAPTQLNKLEVYFGGNAEPEGKRGASKKALIALVLSNLIPVFGVLFDDWDAGLIVLLYWAENLVVGFYAIIKMLHKAGPLGLFPAAFFLLHFGGFCAVHGMFIMGLTEFEGGDMMKTVDADAIPIPFLGLLYGTIVALLHSGSPTLLIGVAALYVSHGISLVFNYFGGQEYRRTSVKDLMQAPYKRVVIMHLTIIVGAAAVMALGSTMPLLLVLVALKTGVDIKFHLKEHGGTSADT